MKLFVAICALLAVCAAQETCVESETTASGTKAPRTFCSGDLIFEENFDELDFETWQHEITLAGGGNWEFQVYTNNRSNSFVEDGNLNIRPSLTADEFGEGFLSSGVMNLHGGAPADQSDQCTWSDFWGCERVGTPDHIINPIRSGQIKTINSFSFKYGKVEVKAKMPAGDWIWPAIWLLPKKSVYGGWPRSGEIDMVESRGNRYLFSGSTNVGVEQVGSTLHFGPSPSQNGWPTSHYEKQSGTNSGFDRGFHLYQLEWTKTSLTFKIDNVVTGRIDAVKDGGFFKRGGFPIHEANPWAKGTIMAPFDQEFYLIINNAVGGTNYFNDAFVNRGSGKPWSNTSPYAPRDFWNRRNDWLPSWNLKAGNDAAIQVDYVRVWAV
ncbi:unnamed protein product [Diamesa serratosioi]